MSEEIREQIIAQISKLYPNYETLVTTDYLNMVIDITYPIAEYDGLSENDLILGTALLTLDMIVGCNDSSNIASRRIDGVSETYFSNRYKISNWRRLYEMLLSGTYDTEYTIHYVGIDG